MWLSDMSGPQVAHNGKLRATYRNKWHGGCTIRVATSKAHISVIPNTYGAALSDGVCAHHTVTVCNRRTSLHFRNSMKRREPRWQAGLRPAGQVTGQNGELSIPAPFPPLLHSVSQGISHPGVDSRNSVRSSIRSASGLCE